MSRIQSVDALRSIAILAVIAIHTTPFKVQSSPSGYTLDLATTINQLARFAVPFFFVISGYFWARNIQREKDIFALTLARSKRILYIFISWSAIYLLPWNIYDSMKYGITSPAKVTYWNICNAIDNPLTTVMQGTKVHLWFLVGLLCSMTISAFFIKLRQHSLLIIMAIILYAIGLAGKSYTNFPLGFHTEFNFRNGPFFSLIFFVTGYLIQCKHPDKSWLIIGLLTSIIGTNIHFIELIILNKFHGTIMIQDYVAGTYFFGTGVAVIALSNCKILASSKIQHIGKYTLGIYLSHYIFIDLLKPIDRIYSGYAAWELSYPILVFIISYMFAMFLSRLHFTKNLVAL